MAVALRIARATGSRPGLARAAAVVRVPGSRGLAAFPVATQEQLEGAQARLRGGQKQGKAALKEGGRDASLHTARAAVVVPGTAEDPTNEVFVLSDVASAAVGGFLRFGLDPAAGSPDPAASGTGPSDLLLQSVAACAGVTMRAVAVSMGLSFDRVVLTVEGDYDLRGTNAVSRSVPVGVQCLRLHADIVTVHSITGGSVHPASDWERLMASSERYCVVAQSLLSGATGQDDDGEPEAARPTAKGALATTFSVYSTADAARQMLSGRLGKDADTLPLPRL